MPRDPITIGEENLSQRFFANGVTAEAMETYLAHARIEMRNELVAQRNNRKAPLGAFTQMNRVTFNTQYGIKTPFDSIENFYKFFCASDPLKCREGHEHVPGLWIRYANLLPPKGELERFYDSYFVERFGTAVRPTSAVKNTPAQAHTLGA